MLALRLKLGVFAFVGLTLALAGNLLFLQPGAGRGGERAAAARRPTQPAAQVLSVSVDPRATAAKDTKAGDAIAAKLAEAGGATHAAAAGKISEPAASALGDGPDTIRAVQRELQSRGYDAGTADGVPGLITRAAVLAYEHDHGLPLTADPNARFLQAVLTRAGQPGAKSPPLTASDANTHAEQVIRTVQQSLTNVGYAAGRVDGRMGEDTVRAIREFEIDQGLPETGRVSGQLVARLARLAGQGRLTSAAR